MNKRFYFNTAAAVLTAAFVLSMSTTVTASTIKDETGYLCNDTWGSYIDMRALTNDPTQVTSVEITIKDNKADGCIEVSCISDGYGWEAIESAKDNGDGTFTYTAPHVFTEEDASGTIKINIQDYDDTQDALVKRIVLKNGRGEIIFDSSETASDDSDESDASGICRNLKQVTNHLKKILKNKKVKTAEFKTDFELTSAEITDCINSATLPNGWYLADGISYSVSINDDASYVYNLTIPQNASIKNVKIIKSEKVAYNTVLKMLKNRDLDTILYSDNNKYDYIYLTVMQQHTEYLYDQADNSWKDSEGKNIGAFNLCSPFDCKESTIRNYMKKADKKADKIIKSIIKKTMSTKQKYKAIHDYIVKNCEYDEVYYNKIQGNFVTDTFSTTETAYGCLIEKKAICQGYSAAFNLLCEKAGLKSISVTGTAGSESHAWNYVKLGKKYLYVDTTWDDPLPDQGKIVPTYNYFLISKDKLLLDHFWNTESFSSNYLN